VAGEPAPPDYNQKVRILYALVAAALALTGCHRGNASKDAVRQAVIDYVGGHGLNVAAMNVEVTAVNFTGDHGEANVSFTVKSAPGAPGMTRVYLLEQQGAKWVVTGSKQAGGMPHGGGAMPGGAMPGGAMNPHGAMPDGMANPHGAGSGGGMPSPQDLPPTHKTAK
jgi:hypothetical protein